MKVLLTGAGSGIGHELARRLAERGDELVLVVRSADRAADFADATVLEADLADPGSIEALTLPERLDAVVHAAGVVELGPVAELRTDAWQSQLAVNLLAPAILTRLALPALRAAQGTVVIVNSGAGLNANPGWAAYAASKFGLRALADSLRAEESAHGVRVTSVYPGRTATPMQEKVHQQESKEYDAGRWIQASTVVATIVHVLDLSRDATVPDVTLRPS
ncbi:SDR family oxidoreductase [Nocardioides sp. DS6]|uniref:SDR family oxidoreductase n=1 Tax=Nocardioides eburneus TaxID=3231482 RepID=A0ABV3T340_9ACTN